MTLQMETLPGLMNSEVVEEAEANRDVCLSESIDALPPLNRPRVSSAKLAKLPVEEIYSRIVQAAA